MTVENGLLFQGDITIGLLLPVVVAFIIGGSLSQLFWAKRKITCTEESCDSRFRRAHDRVFDGFSAHGEGCWQGDFSFVVLADTQLGMLNSDQSWEEESKMMREAIMHINRLKPRFVVVCGDLVNAMPQSEHDHITRQRQKEQVRDFKKIANTIDDSIALLCVCGNHGSNKDGFCSVWAFINPISTAFPSGIFVLCRCWQQTDTCLNRIIS